MITGAVDRSAVKRYLAEMNVFVLSSRQEGLPNALLEAAAAGVPLVATSVDGVKDIFQNGKSALLVEPANPRALARAVEAVINDRELAQSLSIGAKQVARNLTVDLERNAWLDIYMKLAVA